jgi:hypothetical protein
MSVRQWPRADLRVGDADRQRVVDELQRHYVAGRLTSEELGERVAQALSARTFADFGPILADLPIDAPDDALANTVLGRPEESPPPEDQRPHDWGMAGPPIGLILMAVGLAAMVLLMLGGPAWHLGPMPFWSFIWIFFFFGWPRGRGGRRRHF